MAVNIDKFGRIDGSRTTVYHVMDYYTRKRPIEFIAKWLPLSVEQVKAAIAFIETNRVEVDAQYAKMVERCERGDPPEIRALIEKHSRLVKARLNREDSVAHHPD